MKVIEKDIYGEPLTASYEDSLIESLKDPSEAREYLNAALEDDSGDYRVFLLALRNVADAFGMTEIAKKSGLNRVNIYRMLSEKGNPTISSLFPLLHAIGVRLNTEIVKTEPVEQSYEVQVRIVEPEHSQLRYTKPKINKMRNFRRNYSNVKSPMFNCELQSAA